MKEKIKLNINHAQVGYKNNRLRNVQSSLEGLVPVILRTMAKQGLLEGTKLGQAIEEGQDIRPDDVTLAGLQLTVKAADDLLSSGKKILPLGKLLLGTFLDAADGALARHQGQASPEGAIKDVVADRIVENYLATLIVESIDRYPDKESNLKSKLIISFQLSTLTKATCEMLGVQTSEGGRGGMIQRRRHLFSLIRKTAQLNKMVLDSNGGSKNHLQADLLTKIKAEIDGLISESYKSARERADSLADALSGSLIDYDTILQDSDSGAAVEARKYVTIILMMQKKFGIDMLPVLNTLSKGFSFPALRELMNDPNDSVAQVQVFIDEAILLTKPKSDN